ncbi:hypothetical protein PN441_17345 [Spirulina major CS-329]|uniref:hypothetical protein n=1 Tax=Spirulina TaxID=1154 RepID=UPI00232CCB84|nr:MULTISPECIES: hypothetical protein [Spirulina]MDB9494596.1 hypothetical protein [Spirulina subsalsa CS-330]MDB9504846.1 hypothetical protein [Spirulina major CS-329]
MRVGCGQPFQLGTVKGAIAPQFNRYPGAIVEVLREWRYFPYDASDPIERVSVGVTCSVDVIDAEVVLEN